MLERIQEEILVAREAWERLSGDAMVEALDLLESYVIAMEETGELTLDDGEILMEIVGRIRLAAEDMAETIEEMTL